jgi:toxin YoeB
VKVCFTEDAWEEYLYWQKTDRKIVKKIHELIKLIKREPFTGTGKPEPLKFSFQGYWSRRIDMEHRLIYKVDGDILYIAQCRYHYQKD